MQDSPTSDFKQELCKKMASNLSTLREKAKITQDELAERLGLSRQNISAIENGKHGMTWSTFSILVLYFVKNDEIKTLMIAMGIVNDDVEGILNINKREN